MTHNKDSLGDRMKSNYENRSRYCLIRRTPVILRLDGKCFSTLTRGFEKPFDHTLSDAMAVAAIGLLSEAQGAKCAYVQSDEVSILLADFDKLTTEAWFGYNIQKMVSVAASFMSTSFSAKMDRLAQFDARVFNIPKEEVVNYFVWRQKDWERNSLQMLARSHFSHKQLHEKNSKDIHDMLHGIGVNWAELEPKWKNGVFIIKNEEGKFCGEPAPEFTNWGLRGYIEEELMKAEG